MEKYLDKNSVLRLLQGIKTQIDKSKTSVLDTKGVANGIASLDENGNVPLSQLGNVDTDIHEIALELPTQLTEKQSKHIFLVPRGVDEKTNKNIYKEYIFTGSDITNVKDTDWEQLGEFTTSVDLKDYSKKSETISDIRFTDMDVDGSWTSNTILNNLLFEFADGKRKIISIPLASGPYYGTAHQSPGGPGFMSGEDKAKLDKIDLNALTTSITAANTAADNTNKAIKAAETATAGAETCNVTIQGSTISVTNRHGETKSVDVINTDEEVTVTIASSVDSIKVAGIKINVFLNNGKTPQTYTTNAEGKVTFTINRGNYYQVVFPEYGNAQPIAPVGYTAVLGSRSINAEYVPYNEDTSEKVVVNVQKCGNDNECAAWEGMPVTITYDGKDSVVNTDSNGQVVAFVPFGKEYTVKVEDKDGYNVSFNKNSRTYTASVSQRLIDYRFYQFKAGIFVVDANKNEYYIEDWVAAGRNADDAVAIKVADASLSINHGTFCIRTSDIKNVSKLISSSWCTQNLQFNSIALNGNNVKDANYYNGESSSYLIRQEAQERSLSVPAFDYAYGQILNLGGEDLHGFVMSVGQEYVHVANIGIIKQVLETLYGETVATDYYNFVMKIYRWTSSQSNATDAWFFSSNAVSNNKLFGHMVLPVFAC
jgi:hypothetical protein|nr:MAG TPA: collagen adhesion protein [Caudoviricetes sp.]